MRAGEEEIAAKRARIEALEAQVVEMERSGKNLSDAYRSALLELGELRGEVKHLREAADELKTNLAEAKAARDKAQGEVRSLKSENRKLKAALAVVVVIGVRLLL